MYEFIYIFIFALWIHLIITCCYMNSFVMLNCFSGQEDATKDNANIGLGLDYS